MFFPPLCEGLDWLARTTTGESEAGSNTLEIGDQPVEMEVVGVRADLEGQGLIVILKEKEGEWYLPIGVDFLQGLSIDLAFRKELPPRPLTHDLFYNAIEALDGGLSFIIINELLENTFYARLAMKTQNGRQIELDSRPSDAIALALRFEAPVYVEEWVLRKTGTPSQK